MISLIIDADGRVASQGSKNKGAHGGFYDADKGLPVWRGTIVLRAKRALANAPSFDRKAEGVAVEATFALERPASHYRTGKYAHLLREDAPLYCANTPDIDKACRAVLDALTQAGVIVDDRRVVQLRAVTLYADKRTREKPGATVVVTPVPLSGRWEG